MYIVKALVVALLPGTLALSIPHVSAANASQVLSSIGTVGTNIVALNSSINTLSNSAFTFFHAVDVQQKVNALEDSMELVTNTTNASRAFTKRESSTINSAIVRLTPQIDSVLDNMVNNREKFDGFPSLLLDMNQMVLNHLQKLQGLSKTMCDAIADNSTPVEASALPDIDQGIQDDFGAAITAFNETIEASQ
jgi:hypothetical protein